jgi:hypothetical protein
VWAPPEYWSACAGLKVVYGGAGSGACDRTLDLARSVDRDRGKALLGVEQWAEIRRMRHVEGLSQREIHRRTGVHRDTIRRALASPAPPSYGPRPQRPSKLDPFLETIEELLADERRGGSRRVAERAVSISGACGCRGCSFDLGAVGGVAVACCSTVERVEGDVDRLVIAQGAAGSRRGIPGRRVSFSHGSKELILDAAEDEFLGGHAPAVLEAGGRGAREQTGVVAGPTMGGYHCGA